MKTTLASDSCRWCWPDQQAHTASLETTEENRAALLVGLDYLLNISFVDDDEVRSSLHLVGMAPLWPPEPCNRGSLWCSTWQIKVPAFHVAWR